MARSRFIKHSFFQNETIAETDPLIRLFFIGLWTVADFKGCLEYRPRRLKAQLMPYDDFDVDEGVFELSRLGFVVLYSVGEKGETEKVGENRNKDRFNRNKDDDKKTFLKIVNFTLHQSPHKNEREAGSPIPDFDETTPQVVVNEQLTKKTEKIGSKTEEIGLDPASYLLLVTKDKKEKKSVKKENPPPPKTSKKIGSRLPENFEVTDEMISFAKTNAPNISVSVETMKFKNYWLAKAGKDGVKLDWLATWKNWFLKAQQWHEEKHGKDTDGKTPNGKAPNKFDVINDYDYSEFNTISFDN